MNVKLIGFTPNPEKIPAMAAKLTHSITKPENLDKTSDDELKAILKHVIKLGHTSIIEHTSFTFAISNVSRSLTHQLVRHRIASYAQQSQRYVNLNKPNFCLVLPISVLNIAFPKPFINWKEFSQSTRIFSACIFFRSQAHLLEV